jgi:hypothetical protein
MNTKLLLIGALLILVLAAFLDSPVETKGSTYYSTNEDETIGVGSPPMENPVSSYTSLEYRLEEMKEVDGYIVETYREYEVHEDEDGNVVIRIPTSNYNYLRYKSE